MVYAPRRPHQLVGSDLNPNPVTTEVGPVEISTAHTPRTQAVIATTQTIDLVSATTRRERDFLGEIGREQ
jgi:hypothetical protein